MTWHFLPFLNFYLLIFKEWGRERERTEREICCSTYLCIRWFLLVHVTTSLGMESGTLVYWDDALTEQPSQGITSLFLFKNDYPSP